MLGAVRWGSCQANPVATFQTPTSALARARADAERVNSIVVTRMNSRTNAARLCTNALEISAKPIVAGCLEVTRISLRCRAVWLHGPVMQRMLGLSARARLAAVATARLLVPCADTVADARTASDEVSSDNVLAAVATARLLMPCADAVADAWAASEMPIVGRWPRVGLWRALRVRLRLHWRRHKRQVIVIVCEPAPNWLVGPVRSNGFRQLLNQAVSRARGLVQGLVSYRLEDLDLEEGREGVRVDRVVRR